MKWTQCKSPITMQHFKYLPPSKAMAKCIQVKLADFQSPQGRVTSIFYSCCMIMIQMQFSPSPLKTEPYPKFCEHTENWSSISRNIDFNHKSTVNNKASNILLKKSIKKKIEFQLVQPHMHHCNTAEQAIRTWKNQFMAGLCSTGG